MTLNQLIIFTVDFMIIIFAVIFMITHFFKIRYIFQFILCVLVWQFNQHILWLQFNQEYYCYMKCVNGILTKNQTRIACLHLTLSCIFKMLPFIWSSWTFPCITCTWLAVVNGAFTSFLKFQIDCDLGLSSFPWKVCSHQQYSGHCHLLSLFDVSIYTDPVSLELQANLQKKFEKTFAG